jgi:dienelactone hydrolase
MPRNDEFPSTSMQNWHQFKFIHGGISHPVYKKGVGPGVLLMHELAGMTPQCIRLAERIKEMGFCLYLPLFFGRPNERLGLLRGGLEVLRLCIRREFYCLAERQTSPVSDWLRGLCRRIFDECGGKGVGAIGMCLTGNLVIPLMLEPCILAPIACQPALPFGITKRRRKALGLSEGDLSQAVNRARVVPLRGFRFSTDKICPAERFETLTDKMGPGFVGVTIPTGPDHPGDIKKNAHSVFTEDFVDRPSHPTYQQLAQVLVYFKSVL